MTQTETSELRVEALSVAYGPVRAVRDVTLTVRPGRVLALLGQNGAGKSSTLQAMSGLVRPRGGTVRVDGADLTRRSPARRLHAGLCHVPEGRRLFQGETVVDNLLVGGHSRRRARDVRARAEELLRDVPALDGHAHRPAGLLSGGQQQLVAILRGLMSEPRYLLLDEPFSGLSPVAREAVADVVRDVAAAGTGVVVVEQLAAAALSLADDVAVMSNGEIVLRGDAASLRDGRAVYDAYLGNPVDQRERNGRHA